ncbi:YhaN family protein [Thiobacillus sp.]|uniref:YhaN family protein n=1 Tax=Thiobacillus sp. TaxID=924 RepID=UPI0017D0FA84|nr:YhaN family protein [Thiobacillus sp.]MBC2732469.1 AAA family ATPase [Thiobacillus sp.]MBC2741207.1 AAA family ATPase [Thiobacillus sp.]MBC2761431.1 AAA family ATPase [Thiobacillus sp.]
MKLARLLLQAFGPFTDTELDFTGNADHPASNFHLIYGPNEAGKSSALRAMMDLRFGIPMRSPDDFVHSTNQLRIAGVFLDDQGEPIGLVRRKGRGSTLSRFDVATGQPASPPEAGREQELALTGGLERTEFEAMFGLNHVRLRAGGDLLLKGEGELGSTLFEASAGTRGIAAILAGLETDAKSLYNPHGRAQSSIINEARRQLDDQRHLWKAALTRPNDWQALNRSHEQAKEALAEVDKALETLHRCENELTELRTVAPLLREHDRARAELQYLADVPDLPENARENRLAAEQVLRRAEQDLQGAELELARCAGALTTLVIEAPLLEHADAIERLAANLETVARSRLEGRQQQALIKQTESDLSTNAARIAPEQGLDTIVNSVPSAADRVALDAHLEAIRLLGERLLGHRSRAKELTEVAEFNKDDAPPLPDPEARQRLGAALRNAQSLGDISRQIVDLDREIREQDSQLNQALSDLGIETADELRDARPLLDAEISSTRQVLANLDQEEIRLNDENKRLAEDLDQQRLRQRQLAAQGEVVTAETLRLTREHRDTGWGLIRQAYVERTHGADELGRGFDPERQLPEAFETAQGESDRQADLLRADAARAAGYEECAARIEAMDQRRLELTKELTQLSAQHQTIKGDWAKQLTAARLPVLEPEALREWQAARKGVLGIANRVAKLVVDRDQSQTKLLEAVTALTSALQGIGQTAQDTALPSLIDQADRWERSATQAEVKLHERAKADKQRRSDLEKINGLISKAESELLEHETALQTWHARLFLPSESLPDTVKARLDEMDDLARQYAALSEARVRQSRQDAVVEDFATQATTLAAALGEPVPTMTDDLVDRLKRRLTASREQEQQRLALTRDSSRAQDTKRKAESELGAQTVILAGLCAAANVAAVVHLSEREDSATRKRLAQTALVAQKQQLAQASTRSEDELRERLADQDTISIDSEREHCRSEITRLEHEQATARQAEEQARHALEAIDASDTAAKAREAMESAAARYRSAIRPWARLKLAHALLQNALDRFRERAQAPMVAAASTYFSLMTGGRYQRLVADESDDKPVLRAEREDGAIIGVEAMSEGTADQLYLALRMAALELRRASHPQMPLVLDDVLITSDDERAANILRALERFSEGGQVMLFTHHRHLIEVARSALDARPYAVHSL